MSSEGARTLPGRVVNTEIAGPAGEPAYMIDTLPVASGDRVRIVFESAAANWRHGLFIATGGELRAEDAIAPGYTLWTDNTPPEVVLEVMSTHGEVVFYNIWFSGRYAGHESQRHTSGMLRENLDDGWVRFRCQDFGLDADFTSLVFRIKVDRRTGD